LVPPRDVAGDTRKAGGESGIRTHVRVSPKHAFQACAFSHSAISPAHFDWDKSFGRPGTGRQHDAFHYSEGRRSAPCSGYLSGRKIFSRGNGLTAEGGCATCVWLRPDRQASGWKLVALLNRYRQHAFKAILVNYGGDGRLATVIQGADDASRAIHQHVSICAQDRCRQDNAEADFRSHLQRSSCMEQHATGGNVRRLSEVFPCIYRSHRNRQSERKTN
jgi:hypothetical protein